VTGKKRKEIKDVPEMVGDFLREAAVLVLVFFPLDVSLKNGGSVSLSFICIIGALSLSMLVAGIYFEKSRGERNGK
jgi:hypothetical protein